jgi:hypothetical protein
MMATPDEIKAAVLAAVAGLSEEEIDRELAARREIPDELSFIEALRIEDKESGRLVPFTLWPAQREILPLLAEPRLFVLKARQLGLSWLDLAHWLYVTTFWSNRSILIARQTLDDSRDAILRLKVMHASLPSEWQARITVDKATMLGFANGSRFRALTSTKRMGRGEAAYGVELDEFAFWDHQAEQLAAVEAAGARVHLITTGNGAGDVAHKLWLQAERGEGAWTSVFLPWSAHPGRSAAWYVSHVEAAIEPRLARREYAACPEDAFAAPEGVFFERFSRERNVAEVAIVANWTTVRAVDFGYHHPACVWVQLSPEGQPFVVAELVPADLTTEEFVRAILSQESAWRLATEPQATYGDPAGRSTNVQTAESEVEVLRRLGLNFVSKPSGVRDGCVRIMDMLAETEQPLVISTACPWTIEALSSVAPDRQRPDVYDERSPYTHVLDALRYWAVNRGDVSVTPWTLPPIRRPGMFEGHAPHWYVGGRRPSPY